MRTVLAALLLGCASAPAPLPQTVPAVPRQSADALVSALLPRLGRAAHCPSKRVWCIAAEGWATGIAADLPEAGVLVGVTVALEVARSDEDLLETEVTLSVLSVRAGHGLVTELPPGSAAGQRLIAATITKVAQLLRGEVSRLELPPELQPALASSRAEARYPLTRTASEWRMAGKAEARIRRVASGAWVVVETPIAGPEGIFVSIYPDEWSR